MNNNEKIISANNAGDNRNGMEENVKLKEMNIYFIKYTH